MRIGETILALVETIDMSAVLAALVGLIAGLTINYFGRKWDREDKNRSAKEQRYRRLLVALEGFTGWMTDFNPQKARALKEDFLQERKLAWLYCPDDVIKKIDEFLAVLQSERQEPVSNEDKNLALGQLLLAVRRDMASYRFPRKTSLGPSDFRLIYVAP